MDSAAFDARPRDGGDGDGGEGGGGDGGWSSDAGDGDAASGDSGIDAGAPLGDALDPRSVYIFGTLSEGACYRDAIAPVSDPDTPVLGFDCYAENRNATIRPTDGLLLYTNTFEELLREFHCDVCEGWTSSTPYPEDPLANDTVLPFTGCAEEKVYDHLVAPDGSVLGQCNSDEWRDPGGTLAYDGTGRLLHLGFGDTALLRETGELFVLSVVTGDRTAVSGLPDADVLTARAVGTPVAFDVVVAGESDGDPPELWRVDGETGSSSLVGAYPALPSGARRVYVGEADIALDGRNRLYQVGLGPGTFEDIIVRRTTGGDSEVVYTETTDPVVKLHISAIVTGP